MTWKLYCYYLINQIRRILLLKNDDQFWFVEDMKRILSLSSLTGSNRGHRFKKTVTIIRNSFRTKNEVFREFELKWKKFNSFHFNGKLTSSSRNSNFIELNLLILMKNSIKNCRKQHSDINMLFKFSRN